MKCAFRRSCTRAKYPYLNPWNPILGLLKVFPTKTDSLGIFKQVKTEAIDLTNKEPKLKRETNKGF